MKTILFPTDFSDTANNAFKYCLQLARSIKAKIIVMHCYQPPILSTNYTGSAGALAEVRENIEKTSFDEFILRKPEYIQMAEDLDFDMPNLSFEFEEGSLCQVVKNWLKKEKIHIVIMGTHGRSSFFSRLIGSNTLNLINSIYIPILAIPMNASYKKIERIAFTTLFRNEDIKPLREALIIARQVDATVECIYVQNSPNNPLNAIEGWKSNVIEQWKSDFIDDNVTFKILSSNGKVENTIAQYIMDNEIDIVAIIKRNRTFFEKIFKESTIDSLTALAVTPILIYHE